MRKRHLHRLKKNILAPSSINDRWSLSKTVQEPSVCVSMCERIEGYHTSIWHIGISVCVYVQYVSPAHYFDYHIYVYV